ncbi:hypothetical protein PAMP_012521 [Pampus punctatissimus]
MWGSISNHQAKGHHIYQTAGPGPERSRRNALAQELETSWIPECGALQESPESPTWTSSRCLERLGGWHSTTP